MNLFLDAGVSYLVPAFGVAALVLSIVFRECVKRGMGSVESDIQIEWFIRLASFIEKVEGEVDIGNGSVKGLIVEHGGDVPLLTIEPKRVVTFEEVAGAAEVSEVTIETKVGRFTIEVPLASHRSEIAGVAKDFSGCDSMGKADVASGDAVLTGEKGDTRRVALGSVVKLRKTESVGSEMIEVGSVDLSSIASDVGVAEVIGHNYHYIWWCLLICLARAKAESDRSRNEQVPKNVGYALHGDMSCSQKVMDHLSLGARYPLLTNVLCNTFSCLFHFSH